MLSPSFLALVLNGILILISLLYIIYSYNSGVKFDPYQTIVLLFMFTLVISVHGLLHAQMEKLYGYNPLKTLQKYVSD